MSKLTDLTALAAAVPSNAGIAIGGFQLSRVPVALLRAIVARGVTGLHTISAPNPFALDLLAAAGALRSAECGFIGFQYEDGFVIPPALRRGLADGSITLRQRDVYDTIRTLRAAAASAEPVAELALLHAQRVDVAGNLEIDDPYTDVPLANACGGVLATAEVLVDHIAEPTIAAEHVVGVALAERGAAPTACFGHYHREVTGIRAQLAMEDAPVAANAPTANIPAANEPAANEAADAFIVNMARQVRDGEVIVTGVASATAMLAIELARRTHAPAARYINCVGSINARLDRALPTSVEPELLYACEETLDLPELFDLAREGGVDAMFFGAAQIDACGNINLSRIGPADSPKVRFAGPAGSPSMRSWVRRVLVTVPRQSKRNLVQQVDTVTSAPSERNQETLLITDMAIFRLQGDGFEPESVAPDVDREQLLFHTGFRFSGAAGERTPPPNAVERAALQHIDPAGLRYRLLAHKTPSRSTPKSPEKVLHER